MSANAASAPGTAKDSLRFMMLTSLSAAAKFSVIYNPYRLDGIVSLMPIRKTGGQPHLRRKHQPDSSLRQPEANVIPS